MVLMTAPPPPSQWRLSSGEAVSPLVRPARPRGHRRWGQFHLALRTFGMEPLRKYTGWCTEGRTAGGYGPPASTRRCVITGAPQQYLISVVIASAKGTAAPDQVWSPGLASPLGAPLARFALGAKVILTPPCMIVSLVSLHTNI